MSNNKQSSVEWYIIERHNIEIQSRLREISPIEYDAKLIKIEEQSKEIHRQQILEAYKTGWEECINSKYLPATYYEKTYNNQQ